MGEGNFAGIDAVRPEGPASWRIQGRLGIDGEAEPGASRVDAVLTIDGDVHHARYARCADAP